MAKQRRSPGRRGWILVIAALVLGLFASRLWKNSQSFPQLEVAGFRIGQEEYLRAMYQARNDVLSDHAAAGYSLKDWNSRTPLGDPVELTVERTVEILKQTYAVGLLAVERGYLHDAGYDALKAELEEVNRQRAEALASGGVVTGFREFTLADYLDYRASGLRLQFCADPNNPEYQVTARELSERYEADRDRLYRQPESMELAFLTGEDTLAPEFERLAQRARELGHLADALEEFPGLKPCYQEISVHPGNYAAYDRSHGAVLALAAELEAGQLSEVFRQENRICLVECHTRSGGGYAPLEEVQTVVAESIRQSRYDALIARRIDAIETELDLDGLYRFTAAQLQ